jgi:hypothetical protein
VHLLGKNYFYGFPQIYIFFMLFPPTVKENIFGTNIEKALKALYVLL